MSANKELSILKWVGVVLAGLSTLFTLAIVGSHLSGRLAGLGRVGIVGTVSASLLPTGASKRKSVTVGHYQFCKDGVGWRCREIVGIGSLRKRPYLAYLSRAAYERMRVEAPTREELEEKLIEWADKKRDEKPQRSLPLQPAADPPPGHSAKKLAIPGISR